MPVPSEAPTGVFKASSPKDNETASRVATPTKPNALRSSVHDGRLARYTPVRRLRKTLYGDTRLCRDTQSPTNPLVVLKRMDLSALRDNTVGAHENPAAERRVIEILRRAGGHRHIVRYERTGDPHATSHDDGSAMFVHRGNLYTAMEFCADGDLFDHVERQPTGRVAEREALDLVAQIADALAFLHGHDVAHRDVSLENVLLHDGTAKVCDFGLSCETSRHYDDVVGKAGYMAPEVARGDRYDPCAADMWSLGVVLFTLLTGSPLVADETVRDRMLRVIAKYGVVKVLELWEMRDLVGTTTLALLSSLLQVDPQARPTAEAVLAHPAFWRVRRP